MLSTKREELEKLTERESNLNSTLNGTIGDGNKFEAFLVKVYKKKIKRAKKKTTNDGKYYTFLITLFDALSVSRLLCLDDLGLDRGTMKGFEPEGLRPVCICICLWILYAPFITTISQGLFSLTERL